MSTLQAHGITARVPSGFDARIFRRSASGGGETRTVAQFATVPIPADAADFGGGVVTALGPNDIFVTLFEYGPESLGTALFARALLGCGDALTFISVLRYAAVRFTPRRYPALVALTSSVGMLGSVFATLPDRKSTRLNSSHLARSRMPSSA